jgi:hypothetical protein
VDDQESLQNEARELRLEVAAVNAQLEQHLAAHTDMAARVDAAVQGREPLPLAELPALKERIRRNREGLAAAARRGKKAYLRLKQLGFSSAELDEWADKLTADFHLEDMDSED